MDRRQSSLRIQVHFKSSPRASRTRQEVERGGGGHARAEGNPLVPGLAREQQRQILWKAIDALPEKERLALILRDVEGLSTAETAEILASSETTVRSQICRGRLKLKQILTPEG